MSMGDENSWPKRRAKSVAALVATSAAASVAASVAALLSAAATALLAGCAAVSSIPPFEQPLVLLGEVHDHPQQHALRAAALARHLATGARPALLMEQFDRQHQAAIDAAPREVEAIIAAGQGAPSWNWSLYRPFIALAVEHGLPIVAVNVGRDEARQLMRNGLAAHGFDARVPEDIAQAHTRRIVASHCGLVDTAMASRMALAQAARDQQMARSLAAHAERGAVLLAGNGHVRTDIGAPRWLAAADRARTVSIGVLEAGDTDTAYDRWIVTAAHPRPDPCAAMQRGRSGVPL
jgi:uncharacterized iron-regulated protein